ncbi:MAG: DUF2442 domain-containing protein [Cyclobacteriaceae bacterium]
MYLSVINVKPKNGYKLLLTFDNNESRIFDMNPYLEVGVFKELKDVKLFNSVRVSFDTIVWDNGADFDPESLYEGSTETIKSEIV